VKVKGTNKELVRKG